MPKILFNVDDEDKALFVEAARGEQMTLSAWIRLACSDRLSILNVGHDVATAGSSAADEDGASISPAGHHESVGERQGRQPAVARSRLRSLKQHKADPKDKAEQEHGKRERAPKSGMCVHRIPKGSYCKACG